MPHLGGPLAKDLLRLWHQLEKKYPDYKFGFNGDWDNLVRLMKDGRVVGPTLTAYKLSVQPPDRRLRPARAMLPITCTIEDAKVLWRELYESVGGVA